MRGVAEERRVIAKGVDNGFVAGRMVSGEPPSTGTVQRGPPS